MTTEEAARATEKAPDPPERGGRDAEVIAFVRGRSVPCPRCGYELRDLETARCPECGDELALRLASAKPRFGWLVLGIAPGCFSGVAAVLLLVPILGTLWFGGVRGVPFPIVAADLFGMLSAASVALIYKRRAAVMAWPVKRQVRLVIGIWGLHILAFVALVVGMLLFGP